MRNKNRITLVIVCFLAVLVTHEIVAQQQPQYTQYMYNTAVLNPGYTGVGGKIEGNLLFRSQWVGVEGAPENQSFALHAKATDKIGLGITATNDKLGASNNVHVNGNFAYEITTGYTTKLSLGLNAGVDILNVDWSKGTFANNQDPIFQENIQQTRPIFGAGIFFYSDIWYVGISDNNFLNSHIYNDDERIVTDRKSQYYVMGGYVFDLSNAVKFKPAFLTKHVSGAPITVDISANFLIQEKLNLGLGYRYDDAISALAGFQVTKNFFLGYAYDYTLSGFNNYNDGSHEIILKYRVFDQKKRALSPRFF
ncbi:MAG TPA: type IX secretion system membrane protein PorP/SprF [Pricia antarctica]|uniref:Type IX secretion system membrane protein PorP/SprF n=2 Tax=root TaxID=1 RepID=A0A831QNF4_9FLAO|nr:type IX secretion system membrane protein PorP/SprF [Pricia antarctica]